MVFLETDDLPHSSTSFGVDCRLPDYWSSNWSVGPSVSLSLFFCLSVSVLSVSLFRSLSVSLSFYLSVSWYLCLALSLSLSVLLSYYQSVFQMQQHGY